MEGQENKDRTVESFLTKDQLEAFVELGVQNRQREITLEELGKLNLENLGDK